MNLYTAVSGAKASFEVGLKEGAKEFLKFAELILRARDPDSIERSPAICCFNTRGDIISCDDIVWVPSKNQFGPTIRKINRGELYPGTLQERYALCKTCRDGLRTEIKTLKADLKVKPA